MFDHHIMAEAERTLFAMRIDPPIFVTFCGRVDSREGSEVMEMIRYEKYRNQLVDENSLALARQIEFPNKLLRCFN